MTRFLWWLKKELREHRAVLVLLALTIPLGSWLAIHLTRGRLRTADELRQHTEPVAERYAHSWSREEWEYLLLVSTGLTFALVAGGLFGSEARRGTTALIARTPGAWRSAFLAKLLFLTLLAAVVLVLHAGLLGSLASTYDLKEWVFHAEWGGRRAEPVQTAFLWPAEGRWVWLAGLVALGAWVLAASTALPWVGVPVLAGAVVGVGTAVPVLVWAEKHRYFLDWWLGNGGWALLATAVLALALASWAWHHFVRFARSTAATALRLSLVAVLVAALGNVAAWGAVERYRDFGSNAPDLRLRSAVLGVGDRFAFVDAFRGDPSAPEDGLFNEIPGTDTVPFKIDLITGAWERCGGFREEWSRPGKSLPPVEAPVALLFVDDRDGDIATGTWFDARTGERLGRGMTDELPPGSAERLRLALRESSHVRDSAGRRAWLWEDRIERADADAIPVDRRGAWRLQQIPGGWATLGAAWPGAPGVTAHGAFTIDADDGRTRELALPADAMRRYVVGWWDVAHALVQAFDPPPATSVRRPDGSVTFLPDLGVLQPQDTSLRFYRRVAVESTTEQPLVAPDSPLGTATFLARVGPRDVLLGVGEPPGLGLARWKEGSTEVTSVGWDGVALSGDVEGVQRLGEARAKPSSTPLGEPILLAAYRSGPLGRVQQPIRLPFSGGHDMREAWLLYVPAKNIVRVVRPWAPHRRDEVLRVLSDGAVIALEARRRIVRLGPDAGERTVLFPR